MEEKKDNGLNEVLNELNGENTAPAEKSVEKPAEEGKETAKEEKVEVIKEEKTEKKPKRTKQQIRLAVFGFLACFFILVGVISSVSFVWNGTVDLIENKALKEELGYAVFPLVIVDAPEFDSAETLDSSVVISTSIWRLILDADLERYVKDDVGGITVPDADIEYYARLMYGADAAIVHQTIPDATVQMSYTSDSKSYLIESTPVMLPYMPRVDEVRQSGDVYTIKVSYLLPDVTWVLESYRNEIVEKEMEFTLKKTEDGWQILSSKLIGVVNEEVSEPVSVLEESSLPEMSVEESSEESLEESSEEASDAESDEEESSKKK